MPDVQLDRNNGADILNAYVNTYLREEIKEEGIVRNVPPFRRFLSRAGQLNGQIINAQNIARDVAMPRSNVDVYFSILKDTLLGRFLPAYRAQAKVREQTHPKFYWFDPGAARAAAGLLIDPLERVWKGTGLETLVYHELEVYNQTQHKNRHIAFYRIASGSEIDFVIETKKRQFTTKPHLVCLEAKMAETWDRKWDAAMLSLQESDHVEVDKMIGVYLGQRPYAFDGVDISPVVEFLGQLYKGNIF